MSNDTTPPEPEDLIRYDVLAQEALRSVVRKVLTEVARTGLPGDHHFYVTFDTMASGVRMSSRMKEKYPEEMTVVVQHQYWDLETTEHGFSIGLSFDGIPENLLVPFAAIRGFFDPSVQFGLQFDMPPQVDAEADGPAPIDALASVRKPSQTTPAKIGALPAPAARKSPQGEDGDEDADTTPASADVVSLDAFRKK